MVCTETTPTALYIESYPEVALTSTVRQSRRPIPWTRFSATNKSVASPWANYPVFSRGPTGLLRRDRDAERRHVETRGSRKAEITCLAK